MTLLEEGIVLNTNVRCLNNLSKKMISRFFRALHVTYKGYKLSNTGKFLGGQALSKRAHSLENFEFSNRP